MLSSSSVLKKKKKFPLSEHKSLTALTGSRAVTKNTLTIGKCGRLPAEAPYQGGFILEFDFVLRRLGRGPLGRAKEILWAWEFCR